MSPYEISMVGAVRFGEVINRIEFLLRDSTPGAPPSPCFRDATFPPIIMAFIWTRALAWA